jgi:thioredoxin
MKNNEFQRRIKNAAKPVIVDLWAPWCAPCRAMEPAFKQVGQKYYGQVEVVKINADDSPEVIQALNVRGIPTVIAFAGGEEIIRRSGMQPLQGLDMLFEAALNRRKPAVIPPVPIDRIIRSAAGLALIALGWVYGQSLILMGIGGALLFSAFYDRCPIYRAIVPRLLEWFRR